MSGFLKKEIKLINNMGNSTGKFEITLPNHCPWCHSKIRPAILCQTPYDTSNRELPISLVLQCPSCYKNFIQNYKVILAANGLINGLDIDNEKPMPKSLFKYPREIDKISKEFNDIITQSSNAEDLGYNHLAGIGYRKAIEFLVKDYLIEFKNADKDEVSNKPLGKCISDIDDSRINNLARAATWIGNDETHYVRKHIDKDVQDLKKFLQALTKLVSLEVSVSDAENFIKNN